MTKTYSVIIADDHEFFLDGLETALKRIQSVSSCRRALNGKQAIKLMETEEAHVIFMDIKMPVMNGIDATKILTQKFKNVKIIALSFYDDMPNVRLMMEAGASGYLTKDTSKEELSLAIREVMSGRHYYSPSITESLVLNAGAVAPLQMSGEETDEKELLEEEIKVLLHICQESSLKEIGVKMNVHFRKVKYWHGRLLFKTGMKKNTGLVKYAISNGIYKR